MLATVFAPAPLETLYMPRKPLEQRRRTWRQKVSITDRDTGAVHKFYVDFGEYDDGRLGEVFITAHRHGTFVRGTLDTLARTISIALQSGTSPTELAKSLLDQNYPPSGEVEAEGSRVTECLSIADYLGQEISACYGDDGRRRTTPVYPEKEAGRASEDWRTGV